MLFKIIRWLFLVDIFVFFVTLLVLKESAIYTTQIGFWSAALVMIGSLSGYRRMVITRVEHQIITDDDDRDVIEKIEDPHELYSEPIVENPNADIKEAIDYEKSHIQTNRRSLFEIIKDTKATLSFYRIGAYLILVIGFLFLHRHGMLDIWLYLASLGIPIVVSVAVLMSVQNAKES